MFRNYIENEWPVSSPIYTLNNHVLFHCSTEESCEPSDAHPPGVYGHLSGNLRFPLTVFFLEGNLKVPQLLTYLSCY